MPFKPFAHLARLGIAKGITHAYGTSAVVAGQSIGQFHNYPAAKFTKSTHIQQTFINGSSSSGSGAKAGSTTQTSGGDGGLAQYYAAWQHAQQTGDDTEWKQHQFARQIGWKESDTHIAPRHVVRVDTTRPVDILRPSARLQHGRAQSETAIQDVKSADRAFTEAEALARVDDAIAKEIKEVQQAQLDRSDSVGIDQRSINDLTAGQPQEGREENSSASSMQDQSTSTRLTSPISDEGTSMSSLIAKLGHEERYAEIPTVFEAMARDGLVPTVEAYNQILLSAINLSNGFEPWPRAMEVQGHMTKHGVEPDRTTYDILIQYFTGRSLDAHHMKKLLAVRSSRYGDREIRSQEQLYAADTSVAFATKFYSIGRATFPDFALSGPAFNALVRACAQHGMVESLTTILSDMKTLQIPLSSAHYAVVINAYASADDIDAALALYEDYRAQAISRQANDLLDMHVYAALIKAHYSCGLGETGIRFYEKILQSYEGASQQRALSEQLTEAVVVEGLVQHHLENGQFEDAVTTLDKYGLDEAARNQARNKIAVAAADADRGDVAIPVFSAVDAIYAEIESTMAVAAMYLRSGQVEDAKAVWTKYQQSTTTKSATLDFAKMLTTSMIRNSMPEEGTAHARTMFQGIRSGQLPESEAVLDEAISSLWETLKQSAAPVSAQAIVNLFRIMIENGGLMPHVAEDAIAHLGPACVHQLDAQDIALALHVQAYMLPAKSGTVFDTAQAARFSHLLETVLSRGILMDPSTLQMVGDALPKLGQRRPDLEHRWQQLFRPIRTPSLTSAVTSPILPQSPFAENPVLTEAYDPYAHTTDYRTSKIISELLDSTVGRVENHLTDALSRLRNVRRAGRRLQYGAYAKLITAAGKARQSNTAHEIFRMAQTDVPLTAHVQAVRTGWISIYDSMIAACLSLGDRNLASKYHQELLAMGSAPSANTFGIYITTLEGTFDEATEAVKIFQRAIAEGVIPSVFLYNAVIGKLGKARRIDDCLRYFGEMEAQGIRPSSVTYGTLINALCRTSEDKHAIDMFDEMEAAANYRPRPAPYNSIIQFFLNTKRDRSKVLEYYKRMRTRNIKPTSHTYKLLIDAYASLEPVNLTAAETVLDEMRAAGVQPEAVHYGSLIHAKGCVLHDMAGARTVFDSVIGDGAIRLTDNIYQNLLEAMVANHEVAKTDDILTNMRQRGVALTPYIANTLIHGWAGQGDVQKAKAVYDNLGRDKREPSTYEAMTRAFLSVEDHVQANTVVQEMLRKGYPSAVADKVSALIGA